MLRLSSLCRAPAPPKVLVLTMTPNGGAMTKALRILGYNPYTFENAYRQGNAMSHTKEWQAVLRRQKPFDPIVLEAHKKTNSETKSNSSRSSKIGLGKSTEAGDVIVACAQRDCDALVGPPATLAYESILKTCPRSTRVILVEEPDKLAWENEYEQLLTPLLHHTGRLSRFVGVMADLHNMVKHMTELRRSVSAPKTPNTSRSAQRIGALQASALRLGAALDLLEAQVKETVPRDRLLVYRVGEGWGPLCQFLDKSIPTVMDAASAEDDGTQKATPSHGSAVMPFPLHDSGADVIAGLQGRLRGADRVALVLVFVALSLGFVLVVALNTPVAQLVNRYKQRFDGVLKPHFEAHRDDHAVTLRDALKLSKKATMEFEAEVREEGGVITGLKGAVNALANPYVTAGSSSSSSSGETK